MLKRILFFLLVIIVPMKSFAIMEFGADFSYDRQIYGANRQIKAMSRTYSGSLAWYLFNYTALEFNYSYSEDITTDNSVIPLDNSGISIVANQNRVKTDVFGLGLRQSFAGRNARIKPMVSLGYAKQFVISGTDYTYRLDSTGEEVIVHYDPSKRRTDSVFASFILQIGLTERLSLKGSVKSIFPAFKTNQAGDNLKYAAGFSWIF